MPNVKPKRATVRHTRIDPSDPAGALNFLDNVIQQGAQCAAVQADPAAKQALADLQAKVTAAHASFVAKSTAHNSLVGASKTLKAQIQVARSATGAYERAVDAVADGSEAIIAKAGLVPRLQHTPPGALGAVTGVHGGPGKNPNEGVVRWPAVRRATNYRVEVNFTPQSPAGPWTSIGVGASRRRVITAPAPRSQLLARVAALAGDGTQTAWSDPILITTR